MGLLVYLLPILLTVILFLIAAAVYGLYPMGEKSISWCDMNQQAIPILAEYKDVLSGKNSIFLSHGNAGGMNYLVLFFYYCTSPFALLLIFVNKSDLSLFMNVLVMLKMAASSLTAFIYLSVKCKGKFRVLNLALSVSYAFSGYVMMYYQLVAFLDCVYVFPLFLLGLELIDEEKSPMLYSVTLFFSMLFNYYLAYMFVIFAVLRFGAGYIFGLRSGKRALNFVLGSLTAALLSAAVYIPVLIQYTHSARTGSVISSISNSNMFTTLHTAALAVLGSAMLVPLLFFKANTRCENINRAMFVLTLIPLFLEPVNKMWHTGNYMSFPSRYAFITVFSAIAFIGEHIGNKSANKPVSRAKKIVQIAVFACFTALFAGMIFFTKNFKEQNYALLSRYSSTLWNNEEGLIAFLKYYSVSVLVCIAITVLYKFRLTNKVFLGIFLLALSINDIFFSVDIFMNNPSHGTDKFKEITAVGEIIRDDGFFRVKEDYKMFSGSDGIGINAVGAMGYNSIAHYTSLTDKDFMSAIKKLGYSSYWMEVADYGGTMFSDAFLINKYTLKKTVGGAAFSTESTGAFLNPVLPLGIVTSAEIPSKLTGERSEATESLYRAVTGKSGLIVRYPIDSATLSGVTGGFDGKTYRFAPEGSGKHTVKYTLNVAGEQRLYFDCFDLDTTALKQHINESFDISVNGSVKKTSFPRQDGNGFLYLGTFKDRYVTVEISLLKTVHAASFGVFGERVNAVSEAIDEAVSADIKIDKNRIYGTATARNGDKLLLCLPYDGGYTFWVNGKKTQAEKVLTDFIAIPLSEGENEISATYIPEGAITGITVSAIGVLFSAAIVLIKKKRLPAYNALEKPAGKIFNALSIALCIIVFTAVYIAPVILAAL